MFVVAEDAVWVDERFWQRITTLPSKGGIAKGGPHTSTISLAYSYMVTKRLPAIIFLRRFSNTDISEAMLEEDLVVSDLLSRGGQPYLLLWTNESPATMNLKIERFLQKKEATA